MSNEQEHDVPLSTHVRAPVDEARLARQWSRIAPRLGEPRRRHFFLLAIPAVLLVASLLFLLVRPARSPSATPRGSTDEVLTLPDGSRVALAPATQMSVVAATPDRVHLALESGAIDVEATHRDGRSFTVSASSYRVIVVGTHFTVRKESVNGRIIVAVAVQQGRVRVDGPADSRTLGAGESWSAAIDPTLASAATDAAPSDELPAVVSSVASVAPEAPAPNPAPSAPLPVRPVEGPRELLARATEARSSGKHRDAAAAYDALRKRYRTDSRAPLAAFELGRIRLDALGDPAGAAEAFGDAIALGPTAPFREDAEARRVDAFHAMGDVARCAEARSAYLARYPSGLHARRVAQLCAK